MVVSMKQIAIAHYDEIALKGKNRSHFEQILVQNLEYKLPESVQVKNAWGRILLSQKEGVFSDAHKRAVTEVLQTTPGVAVYGIGFLTPRQGLTVERVGELALAVAKEQDFETFRVTAKRIDKTFAKKSNEIEREVGEIVFETYKKEKRVQLKNPDCEIMIEILHNVVVCYAKEIGVSGLPVGSSGKAVALLSGGFDSPVATLKITKRGVRPVCVHFHGLPKTSPASVEKVRDIARVIARYAGHTTLVLVPIVPAMEAIAIEGKQTKLRLILLRRFMNKVAEKIAYDYGAKALITGESVGQVASQTLENIGATADAISLPILRPLCGMNKKEIIDEARVIGTHDISVRPHEDTCSMFVPKSPETRADIEEVRTAETTYDENALINDALKNLEVEKIEYKAL